MLTVQLQPYQFAHLFAQGLLSRKQVMESQRTVALSRNLIFHRHAELEASLAKFAN